MILKEILLRHTAEKFLFTITRTIQTTGARVCLFPGIPSDFQENGIDLLPHRQIMLEKIYFKGLELLSDSASSSDESE